MVTVTKSGTGSKLRLSIAKQVAFAGARWKKLMWLFGSVINIGVCTPLPPEVVTVSVAAGMGVPFWL